MKHAEKELLMNQIRLPLNLRERKVMMHQHRSLLIYLSFCWRKKMDLHLSRHLVVLCFLRLQQQQLDLSVQIILMIKKKI
ncbi:hypothetical protein X975_17520, partial [Stegodyphus mimosarum]